MRFAASRTKGKFYLLSFVLLCTGVSQALDSKSVALRKYETLKTRVTGGDLSVDWGEFRVAAAVAEVDGGYDWHPARERVLADVEAGNLTHALAGAQIVIGHNMAEPEGHLLAMTVYQKMGRDADAQREHNLVDAIVKSIMSSGDGQSAQKAWMTVSSGEQAFVVDIVLDAEAKSQVVVRENGHDYDKMTVLADDGTEHVLWFNTDTDDRVAMSELRLENAPLPALSARR
jgi:hypothetical protein